MSTERQHPQFAKTTAKTELRAVSAEEPEKRYKKREIRKSKKGTNTTELKRVNGEVCATGRTVEKPQSV